MYSITALEEIDRLEIEQIVKDYTNSWNNFAGKGFGNHFTENADFVTLSGKYFSGKEAIESRIVNSIRIGFINSQLNILNCQLREVYAGLVIGIIQWQMDGFRSVGCDLNQSAEVREGIYTHVFIRFKRKMENYSLSNNFDTKKMVILYM